MNPILNNILAVISGLIVGIIVNMGLVMFSGSIVPPPEGADLTTMEGLEESMHLLQPRHYIMPFLAHALGTFSGALVSSLIATKYKMIYAMGIGVFFLTGGIANVFLLPSPTWFTIVDLSLAYIPMAWIAGLISNRNLR
jgi:hypothetical protein